jgi:hypothetical protein
MFEPQRLNYVRGVIGELRNVEWLSIVRRTANAAVVEQDEFVRRCESINERRIPVCTRRTEAIQDQKRSALPDSAINNSSAINRDCRY